MEPVSFATATLVLWTITLYGVLFILTVFSVWAHARERSRFGSRALKLLGLADAGAAALAPLLIGWALGAHAVATAVAFAWLGLAILCDASSRVEVEDPPDPIPPARLVRR